MQKPKEIDGAFHDSSTGSSSCIFGVGTTHTGEKYTVLSGTAGMPSAAKYSHKPHAPHTPALPSWHSTSQPVGSPQEGSAMDEHGSGRALQRNNGELLCSTKPLASKGPGCSLLDLNQREDVERDKPGTTHLEPKVYPKGHICYSRMKSKFSHAPAKLQTKPEYCLNLIIPGVMG